MALVDQGAIVITAHKSFRDLVKHISNGSIIACFLNRGSEGGKKEA